MKQVYSDIIQFRGTHFDFGYKQGELLRDSFILPNRRKQWKSQYKRHFIVDLPKVKYMFLTFAPTIWEELRGLATALHYDMETTIREFGGYYLEYGQSGCSIFTNADYMMRNYDNAPASYEGRYVLFQPTDGGYATIGPSMQITGRTDGMNEKGLTMGYNFTNRVKSNDGFVCNMIGRIILQTCATIDDAVNLLEQIPHRHAFSYVLLDKSRDSVIVEASSRQVKVRQSSICTNHFKILTEENRSRLHDSLKREQALKRSQPQVTDEYAAFQLLNSSTHGVYSNKYGAWAGTLHTAGYFPNEMSTWFALGGDRKPLILSFENWLEGNDLPIKQIKGWIDSKEVFVNMEEIF
ncbi:linear amide C-N hydrolase [Cerasibacillus terrae]|uniref:Linear amide C-N hydrolase n=1 Tax=Cerasibacillus terrae TaxID=2498845 RepID=A0A5C8NZL7_9BACI|nr:C45 family peptidase [Cerasibacillus terrae]TXL66533.1 linear amide C-N hydrolase [Cerasibacillus terrae]